MKLTAIPSLLLSAVLLFYVQPFFGRLVLPFFGSSASVWTTCLAFFQIVLLLGYLYTHFLGRLKPKVQGILHICVLAACALATVRLFNLATFHEAAREAGNSGTPVLSLLGLLFVWIGPAYFALSTNGPLMQAWIGSQTRSTERYTDSTRSRTSDPLSDFLLIPSLWSHIFRYLHKPPYL